MKEWIHRIVAPAAVVVSAGAIPCYATTYLTVEQAQKLCFGGATQFVSADVSLSHDQMKAIEKDTGVNVRLDKQKVWRAEVDGKLEGWVIQDEVLGKHEFIQWVLALNADGSVRQVEILDYRETYGYQIRDQKWRAQFTGKKHGAKLKLDNDIKNVSGATLSCRHITDGVKRLLSLYELVIKK
ncbi:MAG: putative signal peptide protein [Verrucomicrobiales bacterium]|jgi:Na+-translocating ferredoxin:NAD+ oxidoreductase RnfG subunit|nr:putative signal peptide protein [Verrucomicrobiales bacterium]